MPLVQNNKSADMTISVETFLRYAQKFTTSAFGLPQIPNAIEKLCSMPKDTKVWFHDHKIVITIDIENQTIDWHKAFFQVRDLYNRVYNNIESRDTQLIEQIIHRLQNNIARILMNQTGASDFHNTKLILGRLEQPDCFSTMSLDDVVYDRNEDALIPEIYWKSNIRYASQKWFDKRTLILVIEDSITNDGFCEAIWLHKGMDSLTSAAAKSINYQSSFHDILDHLRPFYGKLICAT